MNTARSPWRRAMKSLRIGSRRLATFQQELREAGYEVQVTGVPDRQTVRACRALRRDTCLAWRGGMDITPDEVLAFKAKAGQ